MFAIYYKNEYIGKYESFDEAEDIINKRIISLKGTEDIIGIIEEINFYQIKEYDVQNFQKETIYI